MDKKVTWTPDNPNPKAIARVKGNYITPPICPCGGKVVIKTHREFYGRSYSDWPYLYVCECGNHVGIHPETNIPLGTLADDITRDARMICKKPFLKVCEKIGKSIAYKELANYMGISTDDCHFGLFTVNQCLQAKRWSMDKLENG